jgi:hypothetical protein
MEDVFVCSDVLSNEFLKLENLIWFSTISMGFEIELTHGAFWEYLVILREFRCIKNGLETHFKK